MDLAGLRREYESHGIDVDDLDPDPVEQARKWVDDAIAADCVEANAMTLSTVDADGRPESRYVLLRGLDERGFWFFTNKESAKGRALAANPHAALTLAWLELHRQMRVKGVVEPLPAELSDAYFARRDRASQIGAWASRPSKPRAQSATASRAARRSRRQLPTARAASRAGTCHGRRSGAGMHCSRRRSSSGRAGRAACTTGSASAAAAPVGLRSDSVPSARASPEAGRTLLSKVEWKRAR